jgi:hypothetical protein
MHFHQSKGKVTPLHSCLSLFTTNCLRTGVWYWTSAVSHSWMCLMDSWTWVTTVQKTANLQMHKKNYNISPPINQTPNLQTIKIHKTWLQYINPTKSDLPLKKKKTCSSWGSPISGTIKFTSNHVSHLVLNNAFRLIMIPNHGSCLSPAINSPGHVYSNY